MNTNIQNILFDYEKRLSSSQRYVLFQNNWKNIFPDYSGVYVIWENEKPIYVGETSGLKSRMSDLMRPINHAFTKKIDKKIEATSLEELRRYMNTNYKLSYISIDLGRSEIEEYLILRWRKTLINKPTTRLLKGTQYFWVKSV
ncbi:GIY-YIG nuclease family protein [Sulfurovum sp. TSL1]|uniref:GIY-YIG nuclease family protein n=1 Tax=Sulfurovum sp. TSL1 TaxID=2826994 RepID=UPI001CC587AE|nr:GIY-YIG nuclease family protein [Sulfurovum sp. TSL1]GIT97518.1 hypothetical protein TSL1_03390 [Sulfurovum sp. TSL1]